MAIQIKTPEDIERLRRSCRLAAAVLSFIEPHLKVGASTDEINSLCHDFIIAAGTRPSPLNYNGFPKSICTSVNHVVCHGIPGPYRLKESDVIKVDVSTYLDEFHGDTCKTFAIGKTPRAARDLMQAGEEALWHGIRAVRPGGHIGDIGAAVSAYVKSRGYTVVREYGGHGIGRTFHEDPHVPHTGNAGSGPKIKAGMTFTVEPMINQGAQEIVLLDDDWTVETEDRKLSVQNEHTLAVFEDRVEVLTLPEGSPLDPVVWRA